jgi:hypothetical protein
MKTLSVSLPASGSLGHFLAASGVLSLHDLVTNQLLRSFCSTQIELVVDKEKLLQLFWAFAGICRQQSGLQWQSAAFES